jgi:hypothetical protein
MFNPLSLVSGLSTQIKAGLIIAVAVGSFIGGWTVHGWKTDAGIARGIDKQLSTATGLGRKAEGIIEHKQDTEKEIQYVYRDVVKKIYELPADHVCFTNDSLQLWNRAIAGADNDRAKPAGETTEDDTVATVKEVLLNAASNYQICNSNSNKHNALIDKLDTLKGKMCVCSE